MNKVFNIIKILVIFAMLTFVVMWFIRDGAVDNKSNVDFIKSKFYNGELIDMQNEVSVDSVDDLKWYYDKNDTIVIEYGKILLKYKTSDFVTEDVQKQLNDILITTEQNKETLDFIIYWNGEEITKYVKK